MNIFTFKIKTLISCKDITRVKVSCLHPLQSFMCLYVYVFTLKQYWGPLSAWRSLGNWKTRSPGPHPRLIELGWSSCTVGTETHPPVWMTVIEMFWGQLTRVPKESSGKTFEAHNFGTWARELEWLQHNSVTPCALQPNWRSRQWQVSHFIRISVRS